MMVCRVRGRRTIIQRRTTGFGPVILYGQMTYRDGYALRVAPNTEAGLAAMLKGFWQLT